MADESFEQLIVSISQLGGRHIVLIDYQQGKQALLPTVTNFTYVRPEDVGFEAGKNGSLFHHPV